MDEMFAIKCQNCGGPMYSHQAKRSFECAYCGTVVPWQADAGEPKSALGIRHAPLTVVARIPETRYPLGKIEMPKAQDSIINVWTDAEVTPRTGIEYTRDVNIVVANLESAIASITQG